MLKEFGDLLFSGQRGRFSPIQLITTTIAAHGTWGCPWKGSGSYSRPRMVQQLNCSLSGTAKGDHFTSLLTSAIASWFLGSVQGTDCCYCYLCFDGQKMAWEQDPWSPHTSAQPSRTSVQDLLFMLSIIIWCLPGGYCGEDRHRERRAENTLSKLKTSPPLDHFVSSLCKTTK